MLKRILTTSFYTLCSRGLLTLTNLTIIFLISRFLESSELGIYAITFFFYYLSAILASFGQRVYLSKETAYRRENIEFKETIIKDVYTYFIVGFIISLFVIVFTLLFYHKIELVLLIPVIVAGVLLGVEINLSGIILGEEKMKNDTLYQAINTIIVLGLTVLLIKKAGILGIYLIRAGGSLIIIAMKLFYLNARKYKIRLKLHIRNFKDREKFFFFASAFQYFILRQIDIFILSLIISKEVLGTYFLALRIYLAFALFAEILSVSLTPYISRIFRGKEKINLIHFNKKVLRYFAIGSLIFSILLFVSKNFITTFFSKDFLNTTGNYLIYLSFILFFRFMHYYFGNVLTATKYQNKRFFILFFSSIILIVLNIILGSIFSIYGIIAARAAVEIFIFTAYWITVIKTISPQEIIPSKPAHFHLFG